ncbi:cAMP-binding domain of CRP or a regulatory subunit of cAMP-dependent protein kinases [Mucilaginibacter gossypiicola]|uniref:cAMP-binding domain of CRP or a regulatory subunit of cAMP-dependent protein kinases n=1 Tax=Mucilaginibacter gossypiicola TaxID=551995 RepID=A0A1H8CRT5_9SPHI|nr:Crp/Fnr family transcriptional regulator [Mucilaginibacter gossypiicola]SEM97609.1 cAMP-binding domain of CRP or a regulatory subunit of cAMP-dependent protein kinases [Mucilaginibacter gossypiicola]
MHPEFETYLRNGSDMAEETIRRISDLAVPRNLRRNEVLFSAGEVCRHKVFVMSGLLYTFNISADGNQHILQFSPENSWTLDVESYDRQIPSQVSIGAVEPSSVLSWQKKDFDMLLAKVPQLKKFAEDLIARNTHYSRKRILLSLSATPEEKYEDFVQTFPNYLARLPLRMIAAYLGISIKTLTRIRHAQLQR